MRKNFGAQTWLYPMPVLIIGTYDENGVPDAMNAAWGGIHNANQIAICIDKGHKTAKNLLLQKAFTVSVGDAEHLVECDYVGIVSANDESDKLKNTGFHIRESEFVHAPVFEELPMTLECRMIRYDEASECVIGEIVNVSADERILGEDGKISPEKFIPICFDPIHQTYRKLGEKAGNAFEDGLKLKKIIADSRRYMQQNVMRSAEDLLSRRYSGGKNVVLTVDANLPEEGYRIQNDSSAVQISGGTPAAVIYGIGRFLREPEFRGESAPDAVVRGMYFATHFCNWMDVAPDAELDEYLEDLALWGCNQIRVWFDMHHFRSIQDPAAQAKIRHLKHIFRKAAELGMKNELGGLINEAYAGSPEELRSDWRGGQNGYTMDIHGHYHVELCPSKPGAVDLLLKWREEVFDAFSDVPVHYVGFGCYDQGGCTCADCAPFGANGLWKILPRFSELARRKFPGCKIRFSTWRMDVFTKGEFDFLYQHADELKKYADILDFDQEFLYVLKDHGGSPANLPVTGFTEISMYKMSPWGGYGANPIPEWLETYCRKPLAEKTLAGVVPYCEGRYEDINKISVLINGWNTKKSVRDTIKEYASFYFGPESAEPVAEAAYLMEQNMGHDASAVQDGKSFSPYVLEDADPAKPWRMEIQLNAVDKTRAEKVYRLLQNVNKNMAPEIASSWRWRLLFIRAELDYLLATGQNQEQVERDLEELGRMYHTEKGALPCVLPPASSLWQEAIDTHRPSRI